MVMVNMDNFYIVILIVLRVNDIGWVKNSILKVNEIYRENIYIF